MMNKGKAAGNTATITEMIMANVNLVVEWLCNGIAAEKRIPHDWK